MRRNKIFDMISSYRKRHRRSLRQKLISFVACIIVFCMTYALLLPAIASRDTTLSDLVASLGDSASTSGTEEKVTRDDRFEASFADAELTGVWRQDVLSIAESQIGYNESTSNFVIDTENDTHRGYTRFGDWYGDPYGVWDAMFVSFCLNFAKVEDMPLNADCQEWLEQLDVTEEEKKAALANKQNADLDVDRFFTTDEYEPRLGDLIFFDVGGDGKADRVGLVSELIVNDDGTITAVKIIEGNNGEVQKTSYEIKDRTIMGFASLPVQLAKYAFSEGAVQVDVTLPEDTEVPRNAVLKVTPIDADHDSYAELAKQAKDAVDGEAVKIKLYDISFYTKEGAYINVSDQAQVAIRPGEALGSSSASDVVVLHYDKNDSNPVVLTETEVESKTSAQAAVTFETEGFSTFAVVQVETGVYNGTIITPKTGGATVDGHNSVTELVGKTVIITTADKQYALSSYAKVYDNGEDRLKGMEVLGHNDTQVSVNANKHLLWTFEQTGVTGTVYLKSVATGEYLQLVRDGVAITTELSADDEYLNKQQIYVLRDGDNSNEVAFCVQVGNEYYYLNKYGGTNDFATWKSNFDSENNQFLLYVYDEKDDQPVPTPLPGGDVATTIIRSDSNTSLDGKVLLISTADTYQNGSWFALSSDIKLHKDSDRLDAIAVVRDGSNTVTAPADGLEKLEWKFTADKENAGKYFIRSVATGKYLKLDDDGNVLTTTDAAEESYYAIKAPGFGVSWMISRSNTVLDTDEDGKPNDTQGNHTDGRELSYADGQRVFQTVNNPTTDNYEGSVRYRASLILSEAASVTTTKVDNAVAETGNPLDGRVFAINNVYGDVTRSTLAASYENHFLTALARVNGDTTYNVSPDALWKFEGIDGKKNTYKIRIYDYSTGTAGQYMKFGNNKDTITLVAENEASEIVVDNNTTAGYVSLTAGRFLAYNVTDDLIVCYSGNDDQDNFILSEYEVKYEETSPVVNATDLAGKVAFIVAVNINDNGTPPVLSSSVTTNNTGNKNGLIGENSDINITSTDGVALGNADDNNNLGWYFEATDEPGIYHLVAVNDGGANRGRYLKIAADGLTMVDAADASDIEVVAADVSNVNGANSKATENVVCLRTNIDGTYWYVNLNGNDKDNNFTSYSGGGVNDRGNHLVIVEIPAVTNVVNKINTLLDQLVATTENGVTTYAFSEAGWVGSAGLDNDNRNHQGDENPNRDKDMGTQGYYGETNQQPFVDDYNQAQAYRREMQLLAREIRELYAALPAEDQRYVWRYEIVDSSGAKDANGNSAYNENDLKWLWDVVETVQSNDPLGVKVNLFNYTGDVQNESLADWNGNNNGFTFYHKVQYDEYTMVDTGRDSTRNGGTLGSDESELTMYDTLYNGSPAVKNGANTPKADKADFTQEEGSLAYLFGENSEYRVNTVTMDDGGGLFQKDSQGFYYYYANQNAAWYNEETNKFVLYDTVIRPMYIHGEYPNAVNDVYNFLPFNNPYDDLIFDEPNTIPSNYSNSGDTKVDKDGKAYTRNATNPANTTKTGYLNERVDMWFGMTIEFSFLMANDGMIDLLGANGQPTGDQVPMEFDFYGDDDVWVYIDDVLVLDIGGVHGAERGTINFNTGAVYYEDEGRGAVTNKTLASILTGHIPEDQISGDTLTNGVVHTVKFFYMERGGNVSYCGLKFNMPVLPENFLMVTKTRENAEDTDGQIIGNPYHTFRVVEANNEGNPVDSSGNETTDLSEMVPYFKANTEFDICLKEQPDSKTGTGIVDENGYFTVPVDHSAVFNDVLELRQNNTKVYYAVVEVLLDEESDQYQYLNYTLSTVQPRVTVPETKLDFSQAGAESLLYTKRVGTYTFTSGIQADAESATLNLTNVIKPPLGKLSVTKQLASGVTDQDSYKDTDFTILIEFGGYAIVDKDGTPSSEVVYSPVPKGTEYVLTDKDGNKIKDTVTDFEGDAGDDDYVWEVSSSDGTITLKPGQTATFDGVVAGTYYRVSELTQEGWTPTYSAKVYALNDNGNKIGNSTDKDFTGSSANGEIGYKQQADVTVTNQNYTVHVDVPITKKVDYAAFTDTFTFKVEWINGATTLEAANAAKDFTYYSGASITVSPENAINGAGGKVTIGFSDTALEGMKNGAGVAYYKISEVNNGGNYIYDTNYYIIQVNLTWNGSEGTAVITGAWKNGTESVTIPTADDPGTTETDETANAFEFVNHRTTSVDVTKEVTGGSTADEFEFNYTIKSADGTTEYGKGTFTLNHGDTYHIQDVPIGAIVEVKEADRPDYFESYNVTAYYEAEYGTLTTNEAGTEPNINADANASAGRWVGSIKGSDQTITIPLYTLDSIGADFTFRYAQQDSRKFRVNETLYPMTSTDGWYDWEELTHSGPTLQGGSTNLNIGGEGTNYAPNLDYLKVTYGTVPGTTAAVNVLGDGDVIRFVNEPCASVTVHKTVEGPVTGKQYSFTASAEDSEGKPIELPPDDAEFTIGHDEIHVIGNLPLGAVVTVKEISTEQIKSTTMRAPTKRYEAEEGKLKGSDIAEDVGAGFSGTGFVMNLNKDQTVSFTVTAETAGTYGLRLCYAQAATRSFGVTVNDGEQQVVNSLRNTGAFNSGWTTVDIKVELSQGENTIEVGGVVPTDGSTDVNWAPNLDYIELLEITTSKSIKVTADSEVVLEVVNETATYVLPSTGGAGTHIYTLGGVLLMIAAPLLYIGCLRKRKRERRAER